MEDTTTKTLHNFHELSDPVKTWLASSSLAYLIETLNNKLGFKQEEKITAIPILIIRLVLGDLAPQDFINELSAKLGIGFSSAKSLAHEIEEKLLKPIEIPLRTELGIDITIIHLAELSAKEPAPTTGQAATSLPMIVTPTTPSLPPIGEKQWRRVEVPPPSVSKMSPLAPPLAGQAPRPSSGQAPRPSSGQAAIISPTPSIPKPLPVGGPAVVIKPIKPEEEPKPFILHEEVVPYSAAMPSLTRKVIKPAIKTAPPASPAQPKPEVKAITPPPVKKVNPLARETEISPPKPPAPPILTARKQVDKNSVSRVIHYSSFKTPLENKSVKELKS